MSPRHKVIWTEGMFMRPQHFQQQERHFEHQLHLRTRIPQGHYWGFARLSLDTDALALGKLAVRTAHGVLPDGTPFAIDDGVGAPPAIDVPTGWHNVRVVLALPRRRDQGCEISFQPDQASLARYEVHDFEASDTSDGGFEPALLQVGQLRLRLMAEHDLTGEWVAMPIARVQERRSDNLVVLDRNYIPPTLASGQQPLLQALTRELHGLLQARSEALARRLVQPGPGGGGDVADFLLLQTINRYLGASWGWQQFEALPPGTLFREWMMLCCDLATFTQTSRQPQVWPEYEHDDCQPAFLALVTELRRALSTVLEQPAVAIPLQDRGHGVSVGQVHDTSLLQQAGFVLAVRADMPAEAVHSRFPTQAKLGPVDRIRDLVHLQLPGVSLHSLPVAPRQLPYHAGTIYFELERSGDLWKQLQRSGALAIHLAGEFPGLNMELWAIRT